MQVPFEAAPAARQRVRARLRAHAAVLAAAVCAACGTSGSQQAHPDRDTRAAHAQALVDQLPSAEEDASTPHADQEPDAHEPP